MTPGAKRRRAIGQVLLLAAGLVVLTIISAGSVYLVNQSREDARWVLHTVEVENQISLTQLQLRRAESAQRAYISTLQPAFLTDFENAASRLTPDLMQLRQLTSDNPVQGRVLEEMIPPQQSAHRGIPQNHRTCAGKSMSTTARPDRARRRRPRRHEPHRRTRQPDARRRRSLVCSANGERRPKSVAGGIDDRVGSGLVVLLAGISIFLVRRSTRARDAAEAQLRDNNLNLEATVDTRTADLRDGPMTRSSASPISSAMICARRW